MPGRRLPDNPVDATLCRRCQHVEPAITVRTEPLCRDCFSRYVHTKVVKRMESFRVRNAHHDHQPKLLLPMSFDACSVGLLHVLSHHLKTQADRSRRTGYKLAILHVEDGSDDATRFACVKSLYPEHDYYTAPLSRVMASADVSSIFPDLTSGGSTDADVEEALSNVLASAKSVTARQDLTQILKRRLVVHETKLHDCEAILWGDSTTKLAERTLAETAKGRGSSLPWIVGDGESPHGIPFYFPLRDLLNKEIESYLGFLEPPLDTEIVKTRHKPAVSTKNTTIDHLMEQYFESVEQEYPSIVANVVRTSSKLQPTSLSQVEQQCELCSMPLEGQAPTRSRLCYGCIRTIPSTDD